MAPLRKERDSVFCGAQEQSPDLRGGSSPVTPVPGQVSAPRECAELAQPGRASRVRADGWWGLSSCGCLRESKKLALSARQKQTDPPRPPPPHAHPGTTCLSQGTSDCCSFLSLLQLSLLPSQTPSTNHSSANARAHLFIPSCRVSVQPVVESLPETSATLTAGAVKSETMASLL